MKIRMQRRDKARDTARATNRAERKRPRPPKKVRSEKDPLVRALAWAIHLYTACGLVAAAVIAVLLVRGDAASFRWAFILMLVATVIDSTDGAMARRIRIKEVLPGFDGRKLDDLTDFLTYTFLPLLLIWRAGILPASHGWWLLGPLLASAYGFCQVSAKTDDGYFLGFPSLWNVVAFYLYALHPPVFVSVAILTVLAVLTFVPSRYLYLSQPGRLNMVGVFLGAVWAGMLVWVLFHLPHGSAVSDPVGESQARWVAFVSLIYPSYYMIASWVISVRIWRKGRSKGRPLGGAAA
jgi:phosphatidylcholine synthase